MKVSPLRMVAALGLATGLFLLPRTTLAARSPEIMNHEQSVSVRDLAIKDGKATGVLVNHSRDPVRDVSMLVRHTWYWRNEYHPGSDSPGTSFYHTIRGEIPPNGTLRFAIAVPQMSSRHDGHFETSVQVAGFTEATQTIAHR